MKKFKERIKSGDLQVEIALGISILALAYVSTLKSVRPFSYLELCVAGVITTFYELADNSKKPSIARFATKPVYWTIAIGLSTALFIILHLI